MADTPRPASQATDSDVLRSADRLIARQHPHPDPMTTDADAASIPTLTDLVSLPEELPAGVRIPVREDAAPEVPLPIVDYELLPVAPASPQPAEPAGLPPIAPVGPVAPVGPSQAGQAASPPAAAWAPPVEAEAPRESMTASSIRASLARQLEDEVVARVQKRLDETVDALIEQRLMPDLASALAKSVGDAADELRNSVRQMVRTAVDEILDERGRD